MGSYPTAKLFFGITKWVSWDIIETIEDRMGDKGDVILGLVSAGDERDDCDEALVSAYWKSSKIEQEGGYDKAFDMPVIDEEAAGRKIVDEWKKLGFEMRKPKWHMVASYG